ncbi:MAG: PhoH family protein [Proteobacteria bacterium]|nr:PhoH family protein [Pseudomonadota bacterium]
MPRKKNLMVLDTNVILHDSKCIHQFKTSDISVPIPVLEELDQFKKGNESINFHAREFTRSLDSLSGDKIFDGGIKIGKGLGRISISLDREIHEDLAKSFSPNKNDHRILNIAYHLSKEHKTKNVILISKDVNLRMKAKSVGLNAENYRNDQVRDIATLYNGHRTVENIDSGLIEQLFNCVAYFDADALKNGTKLNPNEYLILRNGTQSALGMYDGESNQVKRVEKPTAYKIKPRNVEQTFALDALLNNHIQLVTISGKAGTGKTLLALAAALQERRHYRQIFMARPVVPLSNKDIGFLPGDIQSKLDPYMNPLYDNLGVMQMMEEKESKAKNITQLLEEEKLVISALSYIRGRSLVKVFFIVDEAQNLTPHEVKTIITRAGEGTKIVFTGDIFQIDHPYLDSHTNGLSYLIEKMKGQKLYAHINLEKGERSELAEIASDLL